MSGPPAELRVMSWAGGWGRALRRAVSDPFEAETGVRVEHASHVGLVLPDDLLQSIRAGRRPPFDVVWSNLPPALRVAREGLCRPLDHVSQLAALSARAARECEGRADLAAAYVVHYVLVYRVAGLPDGPPRSWQVLRDPAFRGRIALYPGGNGFYPIAQKLGGGSLAGIPADLSACWRYVRGLRGQIGELDYSISMTERIRQGFVELCFRALPNALAFQGEGLDVAWTVPEDGLTDTVDCFWVPATVESERALLAQRYIDFALSPKVQEAWAAELGVLPMHGSARPPELLRARGLPESPCDLAELLYVPEPVKADHEPEWSARFARELAIAEARPA